MSRANFNRLLSGKMVIITVGVEESKTRFYVHEILLNSVTEVFARGFSHVTPRPESEISTIELPRMDAEIFKMFLSWLYNNDRALETKTQCYSVNSLVRLYALSISVECDTLKSDTLYALLVVINKNANTFIETIDSKFKKFSKLSEAISRLHTMLNEISELTNFELGEVGSLLELYVETVHWGNEKWQNRLIDGIREKLFHEREVLNFDQIAFVFEGTKSISPSDDKLRKFCAVMVYFRRSCGEGPLNTEKRLKAEVMERFLTKIDGFMAEYLKFEDEHMTEFPFEPPRDPRSRESELGNCYFHFHEKSDICTGGMDLDA
jgi:hypothetical protein